MGLSKTVSLKLGNLHEGEELDETLVFEKLSMKKIQNWPQKKIFGLSKTVSLKLGDLHEGEELDETLVFEKLFGEQKSRIGPRKNFLS